MRHRFFLLCLPIIVAVNISAQKHIPITFQNLLKDDKTISSITYENLAYINIPDTPLHNFRQYLIKTSKGLFVFIDGSGRLYQVLNNTDSIVFKRLDSTVFFGYNIGSFPFAYHDTIYSLGGYGFWRINGQLRMYVNKTRRWDIIGLNEEVPLMSNPFAWYDNIRGKIYIGRSGHRNLAVKNTLLNETNFIYDVSVLDLATRKWKKLGTLNNYLIEKSPLIESIASSPWGQFVSSGNKLLIIDYANNRLLHLKQGKDEIINTTVFADPDTRLYYFKDSTLYFGTTAKNKLDSIQLHINDFETSAEIVYSPFEGDQTITFTVTKNWIYITGGIVVIAIIGLLIWMKRKIVARLYLYSNREVKNRGITKKDSLGIAETIIDTKELYAYEYSENDTETSNANDTNNIIKEHQFDKFKNDSTKEQLNVNAELIFEERELQVLKLIYSNSLHNRTTSINELNKVLGVTQKSVEIQKKQRSDTIISINKKYSLVVGNADNIIERKKSEFDKRTFEYYIENSKFEHLTQFLNE